MRIKYQDTPYKVKHFYYYFLFKLSQNLFYFHILIPSDIEIDFLFSHRDGKMSDIIKYVIVNFANPFLCFWTVAKRIFVLKGL